MKKIALVTGTNSGIGMLTTVELAKEGYFVIATMRNTNNSEELIRLLKEKELENQVEIYPLDVTKEEQMINLKTFVSEKYEQIDILINNAGYCLGGFLEDLTLEEWEKQYRVNVFGIVLMCKHFVPLLKKNTTTHIINISSVSGILGLPGMTAYSSSKFALEGFSEALRLELIDTNIKVSIIEPASYRTKIWDKGLENFQSDQSNKNRVKNPLKEKIFQEAKQSLHNSSEPTEVAQLIRKILQKRNPRLRYPIGKGAKFLSFGKRIVPWIWIENMAKRKMLIGVKEEKK